MQCVQVSILALVVICGLDLLALFSAQRDFSPGASIFSFFIVQLFALI